MEIVITILVFVTALIGFAYAMHKVFKSANEAFEKNIIETINERTGQIQIDKNGGYSLTDIAKTAYRIEANQGVIDAKVEKVIADVEVLKSHVV